MNSYQITFVDNTQQPKILEFTSNDIDRFDILFNSKFSYNEFYVPFNQIKDKSLIKAQATVTFNIKEENYNKLSDLFVALGNFDDVSEVIIYKDDNLICDFKNIIDISSNSSIIMPDDEINGFNLNICEGV